MTLLDLSAIGLQIVLPLVFVAWVAVFPSRSRIGFIVQGLGDSSGLACAVASCRLDDPALVGSLWLPWSFGRRSALAGA